VATSGRTRPPRERRWWSRAHAGEAGLASVPGAGDRDSLWADDTMVDLDDTPADDVTGVDAAVPRGLRLAAAWSWRLLLVAAVIAVIGLVAVRLSEVVMPLFAAFLLTAALEPLNRWLVSKRWPGWLAALVCVLFLVIVVGGLLSLVTAQIVTQAPELGKQLAAGFQELLGWLNSGPLHLSTDQVTAWMNNLGDLVGQQGSNIAGFLAAAGGTIGRFVTGAILALFALFFFLKDGRRFARTVLGWIPSRVQRRVGGAAVNGWSSMVSYVRAAVAVAAMDAFGVGLGAVLLGSSLWVAIMALTFVCAFVPMLGALVAGGVGVLVVLATLGWIKALIMLGVFVVVLEVEVHVGQPLLMGRAVDIHPLVVLVSIAIGLTLAGIPGGVFAIPLVALVNGVITEVTRARTAPAAASPSPAAAPSGRHLDASR